MVHAKHVDLLLSGMIVNGVIWEFGLLVTKDKHELLL